MKNSLFALLFPCVISATGQSQSLTKEARALFDGVKSNTTIVEKNAIAKQSGLELVDNGPLFNIEGIPGGETAVVVQPTDINEDGNEEVFIQVCNAMVYGNAGCAYTIFIKNEAGSYLRQEDVFSAFISTRSTSNLGYPDLLGGGPGFKFPVYRWNGTKYITHLTNQSAKQTDVDIATISEKYQKTVGKENKAVPKKISSAQTPDEKPVKAEPVKLTNEAAFLFRSVKTKITDADKNDITKSSGVVTSDSIVKGSEGGKKIAAIPYPIDLNNDGVEEIFICLKSKSLGIATNVFMLFVKDANGKYQPAPGTLGNSVKILNTFNLNFPDLMAGVPGMERELLRWDGKKYGIYKRIKSVDAFMLKAKSVEDESEKYTGSAKNK